MEFPTKQQSLMFMSERKSCALLYAQCIIIFGAIISPNFTSLFQNHIGDMHTKFSALLQVGLALFWLIHLHGVNLLDLSPICHKHPTTLCLCRFNKQTLNLTEARKKIKLQRGLLAHSRKSISSATTINQIDETSRNYVVCHLLCQRVMIPMYTRYTDHETKCEHRSVLS